MEDIVALVMAAGKGTRMKSNKSKLVHKIYGYLKSYGLSDSDIFKTLTSNSNKLIYFTQMIEQQKYGNQISLEEDKNFERFVNYTAECLKNSKSGTESYRNQRRNQKGSSAGTPGNGC